MPGILREAVENPIINFKHEEPREIDTCACGCGETIYEGYEHIFSDGEWFYETECLMKYHGASWKSA